MNIHNEKSLLAAIAVQTIKDYQSERHRGDARQFIESGGFDWLWAELTEDMLGLPNVDVLRHRIVSGDLVIHRAAYHAHDRKEVMLHGVSS